jgi:hypothetical protein
MIVTMKTNLHGVSAVLGMAAGVTAPRPPAPPSRPLRRRPR